MALPFIKGIARRLSTGGKGETAVVPAQESPEGPSPAAFPGERGKRPSRVGLRAFFGGGDSARDAGEDSVGQLVRQIRAQSDRMSKSRSATATTRSSSATTSPRPSWCWPSRASTC